MVTPQFFFTVASTYLYNFLLIAEFLGRTEVRLSDVYQDSKIYRGPLLKRLALHEVETGEIIVKLDLQLFKTR